MHLDSSFSEMAERLRAGDERAAAAVFERYANRLIAVARTRLEERVRARVDADDVVQSVFRSFFSRQANDQFQIEDWDGLWALLVRITVRKSAETARKHRAARRNVARESSPIQPEDGSSTRWEAPAREPTPEEVATLHETMEAMMAKLDERQRNMLSLHLQGFTVMEIGEQVGRSERAVHRTLATIRRHLESLATDPYGRSS
jgi:RNA polymerase sigma-70 factor (ECF subfamily)